MSDLRVRNAFSRPSPSLLRLTQPGFRSWSLLMENRRPDSPWGQEVRPAHPSATRVTTLSEDPLRRYRSPDHGLGRGHLAPAVRRGDGLRLELRTPGAPRTHGQDRRARSCPPQLAPMASARTHSFRKAHVMRANEHGRTFHRRWWTHLDKMGNGFLVGVQVGMMIVRDRPVRKHVP
jgi:hypothetical protein